MFGIGASASHTTYGVLIDIGSGTVAVAIIASDQNKKLPEIIYSHRATMRITTQKPETEAYVRRVREALLSATLLLSQEGIPAMQGRNSDATITKIYVSCASPWSYTVARKVHYEDNEPFKITRTIIDDLIESAEEQIIEHLDEHNTHASREFEIIERATVDISVNEYPVKTPIGLKGRILELSHVAGAIPKEIMDAIREVQEKLFPETELRVHTYMLIMYCITRDLFADLHTRCLIDITTEAIEFGIVENNLLIENTSIPYGSNTFVRDAIARTGKPVSDVLTSIREFGDGLGISFDDLGNEIAEYIEHAVHALDEIHTRRTIPHEIIVTAHDPFVRIFSHIIEHALTRSLGEDVRIIRIPESIITEVAGTTELDVYISLGARFFHKLHGCTEIIDE